MIEDVEKIEENSEKKPEFGPNSKIGPNQEKSAKNEPKIEICRLDISGQPRGELGYFVSKKGLKTPLKGVENKIIKSPKLGCKISDMEKLKVSSLEVELMSFNVESKPVKKVQNEPPPLKIICRVGWTKLSKWLPFKR